MSTTYPVEVVYTDWPGKLASHPAAYVIVIVDHDADFATYEIHADDHRVLAVIEAPDLFMMSPLQDDDLNSIDEVRPVDLPRRVIRAAREAGVRFTFDSERRFRREMSALTVYPGSAPRGHNLSHVEYSPGIGALVIRGLRDGNSDADRDPLVGVIPIPSRDRVRIDRLAVTDDLGQWIPSSTLPRKYRRVLRDAFPGFAL